jgi:hypothetical protein
VIRWPDLLVLAVGVTTISGVAVTVVALFTLFNLAVATNWALLDLAVSITAVTRDKVLIVTFFDFKVEKAITANVRRAVVQAGIVVRGVTVIASLAEFALTVAADRSLRASIDGRGDAAIVLS